MLELSEKSSDELIEEKINNILLKSSVNSSSRKKSNVNSILKIVNNNPDVINFILRYFDLNDSKNHITATSTTFNIDNLPDDSINNIINLKLVNDFGRINKIFESINKKLPKSGIYLGCVETYPDRRKVILEKYPIVFNWFAYLLDFIFKRFIPKLKLIKWFYFYLTKGKGRVISRAETFGRLYSCGFEIVDQVTLNNMLYFVVKKVNKPSYDKSPTYGPLIRLVRIGKNGKKIKVYKFRTMHPFSEYLQEYIYKKNKLQEGGKIKNDFRISSEGKFLRKFWIDELPMIYNFLKGDLKLVGVRPLSKHYFSLYSKELQKLRTEFKPGLIPPFYVDLPKTMDEIMQSELKYLNLCKKSLIITDFKYFFLAIKNILYKGVRSK